MLGIGAAPSAEMPFRETMEMPKLSMNWHDSNMHYLLPFGTV